MNEISNYILVFCAGILLGAFFFGGLLWTTKKGLLSKNPALIFITSAVLRISITLIGFYYLSSHQWDKMLICLVGFILARFFITRIVQQSAINKS